MFVKTDNRENLFALIKQIRYTIRVYGNDNNNTVINAWSDKEVFL